MKQHLPSNFTFKSDERYRSRVFSGDFKSAREYSKDIDGMIEYCLSYYKNALEDGDCTKAHIIGHGLEVFEYPHDDSFRIQGDVKFILVSYR